LNIVSLVTLTILINFICVGCTPVSVSLNSEFGLLTVNSPSEEQIDKIPKISITAQPLYINKSNSQGILIEGTCENVTNIQVKINNTTLNTPISCASGNWSATLDTSNQTDGTVSVELLNKTTSESLKTISLEKDTVPPVALLATTIPAFNKETNLVFSVDPMIGVSNYSYKYGLAMVTDCSAAVGYSAYTESATPVSSTIDAGDGNYKLCLIGKDAFENEQAYTGATVITWQLDTVDPILTFLSATSNQYINSSTQGAFSISVNCSETGRNVMFKAIDSSATSVTDIVPCSATSTASVVFDLNPLSEGPVSFQVHQEDLAGNSKLQTVLNTLKDITGPVFVSSTVADGNYFTSLLQGPIVTWLTASDGTGSGFFEFKVGYGASASLPDIVDFFSVGTNTSNQYSFISPLNQHSTYYAFVKAIDLAGNSTIISSDGWQTDSMAPTVGAVDDGAYSMPGSTPMVSWGAGSDSSGSGINYYELAIGTSAGGTQILNWLSVGTVTSITQPNSEINFGAGTYYVSIRAVDNAGNTGTASLGDGFNVKPTISSLASNTGAYAAVMTNGKVVSWGDGSYGGDYTLVPAALKTGPLYATSVVAAYYAFAAITNDGAVHAWGDSNYGGSTAAVANQLNGSIRVNHIISTSPSVCGSPWGRQCGFVGREQLWGIDADARSNCAEWNHSRD
jgi:hypothetical protein